MSTEQAAGTGAEDRDEAAISGKALAIRLAQVRHMALRNEITDRKAGEMIYDLVHSKWEFLQDVLHSVGRIVNLRATITDLQAQLAEAQAEIAKLQESAEDGSSHQSVDLQVGERRESRPHD